jgi:periplasmic divalent cation tolerance protein
MTDKIAVLSTCESEDEARRLARELVEARLAACVNIVPGIRSVFQWKGAVEEANELLLVVKTSRALLNEVRAAIERLHSYELPEVIAFQIVDGSAEYLEWLAKGLKPAEELPEVR